MRQAHRLSPDRGPTAGALIRATIYLTKRAGSGTIEVWNAPQNRSASRKQWSTSRTPTTAASTLWRGAGPPASNAPHKHNPNRAMGNLLGPDSKERAEYGAIRKPSAAAPGAGLAQRVHGGK